MRIFSKKSLQFDDPAGEEPAVVIQHLNFADVPDWVAGSVMFKLANADGDVEVIGSKQDEKAAETGSKDKTKAEKATEAKAKKEADEEQRLKAEADEAEKARLLAEQQQ